jgi:hypothetical protein
MEAAGAADGTGGGIVLWGRCPPQPLHVTETSARNARFASSMPRDEQEEERKSKKQTCLDKSHIRDAKETCERGYMRAPCPRVPPDEGEGGGACKRR